MNSKINSAQLITGIFLFLIFMPLSAIAQNQNELSIQTGLIRGGTEPENFFDGHSIGVSYNHQIIPYIYLNTGLSVSTLYQRVDDWPDLNNHASFMRVEIGAEFAPLVLGSFQLRLSGGGSFQNRATTQMLDPRTSVGWGGEKVSNYQYRSHHVGYKFELILQFQITDRVFIAPASSMRSYPRGDFWTPNTFDMGIRAGIKM